MRTVVRRAAARRLAEDVLTSPVAHGTSSCPDDDATQVELWFHVPGQQDQEVVVGLRGCTSVWASGRHPRHASADLLDELRQVAPQPWRRGLRAWLT